MRKVLIDIGGHIGQSIEQFYQQVPDASAWKIYSFEPICYNELFKNTQKYGNVQCIDAAVIATGDKVVSIYVPDRKENNQGCSIVKGKTTAGLNYNAGKSVSGVNLVDWFLKNTEVGDFVVVKMNIEGAEYELMPTLLAIMSRINGLIIKLHSHKFAGDLRREMELAAHMFSQQLSKHSTKVVMDSTEDAYDFRKVL